MCDFDYFNEVEPSEFDKWLYKKDPELVNTIGLFLKDYENLTYHGNDRRAFYVDSQNETLFYFYHGHKYGGCYFKYYDFWKVIEGGYGMKLPEIQEVLKVWLGLTYDLGELTPTVGF